MIDVKFNFCLDRQGHTQVLVLLLQYGADPSLRDGEGCACIHLAAQFGHTAIVGYLIAKGQSVNIQVEASFNLNN